MAAAAEEEDMIRIHSLWLIKSIFIGLIPIPRGDRERVRKTRVAVAEEEEDS